MRRALVLAALVLGLAGCGGDDDEGPTVPLDVQRTIEVDGRRDVVTGCHAGNRLYLHRRAVTVVPYDPTCPVPDDGGAYAEPPAGSTLDEGS